MTLLFIDALTGEHYVSYEWHGLVHVPRADEEIALLGFRYRVVEVVWDLDSGHVEIRVTRFAKP